MGSGCPTNTGLGVSARVSGWGARSGDPSPASPNQQPCGPWCLHFLTPSLVTAPAMGLQRRCRCCVCRSDFPHGPSPLARLPARLHMPSVTGVPCSPPQTSHSAAQDMFGAAHAPVRDLRITNAAVPWGLAPCTGTEDVRVPRHRSGSGKRALGSGRCAAQSRPGPGVSLLP